MKKKIRVFLRALEPEDAIKIHQWRQDEELKHSFSGIPLFSSSLNEKKWVEDRIFDKENTTCAICLKENQEFIGCIFLNTIDYHNRSAHAPTFIGNKEYLGKGYAVDARILMLKYAFFDRGLHRIWAKVMEGNNSALKMLEKCGYQTEGVMQESRFSNGEYKNELFLAVLKPNFLSVLQEYEL